MSTQVAAAAPRTAVPEADRSVLRELAREVASIAALAVQRETIELWKALNGLRPVRPMVMIDQVCWHEMDVEGELTCRCTDRWARRLETTLRRRIYRWRHMPVDTVVEAAIDVPLVIRNSGFGIRRVEETAVTDPANSVVGHRYIDQLPTEEDIEKIRTPELELDEEATARERERAEDVLGDILRVRLRGVTPMHSPWDMLSSWRGVETILMDIIDRPAFVHATVARLTGALRGMLDQLESKGLLGPVPPVVHCTGAWTDELPASGHDGTHFRAADTWTFGHAQMFSTVSPAMHREYELEYAAAWYRRFGLVYYGCCEPLHLKVDVIRECIPNVRKISMSPWVDLETGAERIGRAAVFSRKPNPAFLAGASWNPQTVREDIRRTMAVCARHGCPVEFILKDISTVCYRPQRLWEWARIAAEEVGARQVVTTVTPPR